ncbi:MAG: LamG domain-containing protein [Kiritimatiellia bacterium]
MSNRRHVITRHLLVAGILLAHGPAFGDVLGYWRFEEGSGATAADQTGRYPGDLIGFDNYAPGGGDSGFEGWSTNVSAATVPQSGVANTGSIRMQGGGEYVDLSNGQDMNLGLNFTIEFLMSPDNPGSGSPIFGFAPFAGLYFNIFLDGPENTLSYGAQFMGTSVFGPATDIALGTWQHVALVKQPGEYTVYLNGSPLASGSLPPSLDGPYFFPGTDNTGDRTIGGDSGTFSGYLDEFRISDTALTPNQFLCAIPEPSTLGLLLLGAVGLAWRKRGK